jgi:hypothetical protein
MKEEEIVAVAKSREKYNKTSDLVHAQHLLFCESL